MGLGTHPLPPLGIPGSGEPDFAGVQAVQEGEAVARAQVAPPVIPGPVY